MGSRSSLPILGLLLVVLFGAWQIGQGPESSFWSLRRYARQNLASKAVEFVDRASLEMSFSRETGQPFSLSRVDPFNIPGVTLGTPLVCEPVASLLDGLGPGMPFRTRACSEDSKPVIRIRRAGLLKAYLTPEWRCEKQPRIELEFRLHGIRWRLADYTPLQRRPRPVDSIPAVDSPDSNSQVERKVSHGSMMAHSSQKYGDYCLQQIRKGNRDLVVLERCSIRPGSAGRRLAEVDVSPVGQDEFVSFGPFLGCEVRGQFDPTIVGVVKRGWGELDSLVIRAWRVIPEESTFLPIPTKGLACINGVQPID